jgi:integrase
MACSSTRARFLTALSTLREPRRPDRVRGPDICPITPISTAWTASVSGSSPGRSMIDAIRHAAQLRCNVFRGAAKWGIILRSPVALLDADDLPKVLKPESPVLTESEVQQLLQEAKHSTRRCTARHYLTAKSIFYPAIAFALYTGTRLGEVMVMRRQDVDFCQRIVTMRRSLSSTKRDRLRYKRPKNDKLRTACSRRSSPRFCNPVARCKLRKRSP